MMKRINRLLTTVFDEGVIRNVIVLTLLGVGIVGLWYGARMAYKFGMNMSHEHAVTLVLVSLLAAVIFPAADIIKQKGWDGVAGLAKVCGVGFLAMELVTHMGYTFGARHENVVDATFQATAKQEQVDALAEQRRILASLEKRYDFGKSFRPSSVVAADVRTQEGMFLFKRSKECADVTKDDSKNFCLALGSLRSELAASADREKVEKQIAELKLALDKQRDKTVATKAGHSSVIEQRVAFAKLVSFDLRPDADSTEWIGYILGVMIAVCTTLTAPIAFWLACLVAGVIGLGGIAVSMRNDEPMAKPPIVEPKPAGQIAVHVDHSGDVWKALHSALNGPKTA